MQDKTNLLGYSQKSLEVFFKDIGEPSFRAKQLLKWVHQKGELDFAYMEKPQSIHLSREYYPYWNGIEDNNTLEDFF